MGLPLYSGSDPSPSIYMLRRHLFRESVAGSPELELSVQCQTAPHIAYELSSTSYLCLLKYTHAQRLRCERERIAPKQRKDKNYFNSQLDASVRSQGQRAKGVNCKAGMPLLQAQGRVDAPVSTGLSGHGPKTQTCECKGRRVLTLTVTTLPISPSSNPTNLRVAFLEKVENAQRKRRGVYASFDR